MKFKILTFLISICLIICVTAATPKNKYNIFVDVESSYLYLFKDGVLEKTYKCAGGKTSTPSPVGTWRIVQKDTWGEGFGGRWMGFDCPWGKFGIHGTNMPNSVGYSSSHGCIRMYNDDVKELYDIVPHNTKVTIEDGCYGIFGKGFRTLKPGMYGADVMEVQKRLKQLGFFNGYVNGMYDASLQDAAHRFQKKNKMAVSNTIYTAFMNKLGFTLME